MLIALKIATLVGAALATLIAFTGPTHPEGRPLWYLNLRGWVAAGCLLFSLAAGIGSERLQADQDAEKDAKLDGLVSELKGVRISLREAQEQNTDYLGRIETLQTKAQEATRRVEERLDEVKVDIDLVEDEFGVWLENAGTEKRMVPEVDAYVMLTIAGKAESKRHIFPLLSVNTFRLDPESFTRKGGLTFPKRIYGAYLNSIEVGVAELRERLEKRFSNRWGPQYDIGVVTLLEICARIEVLDGDGGLHRDHFVYRTNHFSSPSAADVSREHADYERCKDEAEAIPSDRSFDTGGFHGDGLAGSYAQENMSRFLTNFMLDEEAIRQRGIEFTTKVNSD